jgi:PAS domain S-box-containing protein
MSAPGAAAGAHEADPMGDAGTPGGERKPPRLVLRFAATSAIALALAGTAILWFLSHDATERAQEAVGFRARSVATTILRDGLEPSDFRSPVSEERRRALDELFARQVLVEGAGALRVKLVSPAGIVTYSSEPSLIGSAEPASEGVRRARDGETVLEVGRLDEGGQTETKALDAYVPVRLTSGVRPSGVFAVAEDYAPVAREVREAVKPVAIVLALALLALYASLVPILRRVTRALEVRNRRLGEAAFVRLLQVMALAANEAATIREATQSCVDAVCAHTGWTVGHVYLRAGEGSRRLIPSTIWHLEDPERFERFRRATESIELEADAGLTGQALATGRPVWIPDVTQNPTVVRADDAGRAGLRTGFAVPVLGSNEVAAVLEFFSTEVRERDEPLMAVMAHVGAQLGRVVERMEAAEALRANEERFRTLVANIPGAIYRCANDADWTMEFLSDEIEEISGYPASDFIGNRVRSYASIIHPDDREALETTIRDRIAQGQAYILEYRILRADGGVRSVYEKGQGIFGADGQLLWLDGAIFDVTEQRRAEEALRESEEQLRQSQKMEAVGRLAGGVAHDFNNLLTAIIGRSELILGSLGEGTDARSDVQEIREAADRAASLTGQLLAFSRKQVLEPKTLDVNVVVAGLEKLLRRLIGEDVELVNIPAPKVGAVKADPGRLEQVVLNLAINARDAMPDGGRLTIGTADVELAEGPHVLLEVSDNGVGMDAQTRSRAFEPFFTTKEPGQGTGLGLSTVYGIVEQSGGHISVESELGRGTTFRIYLPRVEGPIDSPGLPTSAMPRKGSETVLLVEDERIVRTLVGKILEQAGYTVLAVDHPLAALETSERHEGPIDLVLTDVVMPQMGGHELAGRLSSSRPEAKVLYMSGYTESAALVNGANGNSVAFLQKPFTAASLAQKVREVLDAA